MIFVKIVGVLLALLFFTSFTFASGAGMVVASSRDRYHDREYRDRLYADFQPFKRFYTDYDGRRLECIQFFKLGPGAIWCEYR